MAELFGESSNTSTAETAADTPITETLEFKAAVSAAVASAVADILPGIIAKLTPAGASAPTADNQGWAEKMAMAIAQLTDQGDGKRFVAPEILRARQIARAKMDDLLIDARVAWSEARERGDKTAMAANMPSYRLRNKCFLDETMVEPMWIDAGHKAQQTVIDWPGVPNESMIPDNDVARDIHSAFVDSIGNLSEKDKLPEKPLHITRGGLVVKGPPPRGVRQMGGVSDILEPVGEGLRVKHKDADKFKEVHVLGTAHAPARQSI